MFLCADLDAFFVSVEQARNPDLKGKPVIVGGLPEKRGVVASASYEARRYGIHSGMPTSRAYRLCPQAIFLRGNFPLYNEYSKMFYKILTQFSPEVNMVSIDEAYINIKGTRRLFGPPEELGRRLKKEVKKRLDIPVTVGIARTKVFSKIACERAKPNGLLIIPRDQELNFLLPLKVNLLPGIGPKTTEILKALNIKTVADLIDAPNYVLETALGNHYRIIKFFIYGGDYQIHDTMKSISREMTLPEDTINQELIYALLLYLTERGCTTLREKELLAETLTIKIRFSDFKTITKRTRIPLTNAQQRIFEYGARLLKNLLKEKKRIRLLGITLSGLQYNKLQPSIFEIKEARLNQLNYALDQARQRFGFKSIFPASTFILRQKNIQ